MKRSISIVLALIMVLSIFSGIRVSAENGYLYNTGKRGVVQTTPSQYAIDYYTDSYSYENLSELSPSDLRTALNNLIERDKVDASYASLVEYFPYTDADCENEGNIILFYCNLSQTAQWAPAKYWNREHMWPDSKGGSALEGDVHAMRPTDPKVNSSRGNLPYGEGHTGKPAYANEYNQELLGGYFGGAFEPLDIAKGDCARTVLYDYVAQTHVNVVDTIFESRETLLKWCQLDPVDQFEMSRNDSAQSIQKNRNPFVDYPELAWIILGEEVPADLVSPNLGAVSYSIIATSNNTAYGTVSVSGRRITAVPAEGYYAAGYTVLSGKATVTQSGNVFTVAAESDCEICINFEKKTVVTVSFNGAVDPISGYAGEPITLPEAVAEDGYRFIGWVDQPVQATTEQPSYYEAGGEYIPNGSVNLYPLYSYTEGGKGTGWSLVDQESDLYAGAKLIMTANTKGKVAGSLSNHVLTAETQSFGSDLSVLENASQEALTLVLGGEQGAWTLSNESGQALGATSAKNLSWGSGTQTWNITVSVEGAAITSTDGSCGKFLYNVSSPRFTTYTSGASSSMLLPQLYINDGGVLYFTTELSRCEHSNTSYTEAVAATCTAEGNPAYYTCAACGRSFADASCTEPLTGAQLAIPALGHEPGSYGKDAQTHWQLC
ncbi:MAG: endonuclease, partial [Oscillospiraceae bacterium]|nr:endonuclease [Oscillospiraceae bacterium]